MTRYKILIRTGRGKNLSQMGSTLLPSKIRVTNWIRKCPVGNYKTKVEVKDILKNRTMIGTKSEFGYSKWKWK